MKRSLIHLHILFLDILEINLPKQGHAGQCCHARFMLFWFLCCKLFVSSNRHVATKWTHNYTNSLDIFSSNFAQSREICEEMTLDQHMATMKIIVRRTCIFMFHSAYAWINRSTWIITSRRYRVVMTVENTSNTHGCNVFRALPVVPAMNGVCLRLPLNGLLGVWSAAHHRCLVPSLSYSVSQHSIQLGSECTSLKQIIIKQGWQTVGSFNSPISRSSKLGSRLSHQ